MCSIRPEKFELAARKNALLAWQTKIGDAWQTKEEVLVTLRVFPSEATTLIGGDMTWGKYFGAYLVLAPEVDGDAYKDPTNDGA